MHPGRRPAPGSPARLIRPEVRPGWSFSSLPAAEALRHWPTALAVGPAAGYQCKPARDSPRSGAGVIASASPSCATQRSPKATHTAAADRWCARPSLRADSCARPTARHGPKEPSPGWTSQPLLSPVCFRASTLERTSPWSCRGLRGIRVASTHTRSGVAHVACANPLRRRSSGLLLARDLRQRHVHDAKPPSHLGFIQTGFR